MNQLQALRVVIQVKSGHVEVSQIRDLIGVMSREKSIMGVFITLEQPTNPMSKEAMSAGYYESSVYDGQRLYPRIQIITIEKLL